MYQHGANYLQLDYEYKKRLAKETHLGVVLVAAFSFGPASGVFASFNSSSGGLGNSRTVPVIVP
jgi:hypothetical protein